MCLKSKIRDHNLYARHIRVGNWFAQPPQSDFAVLAALPKTHHLNLAQLRAGVLDFSWAINRVASYGFHASRFLPRYPVNAFLPRGQFDGLLIGEKAEMLK